MIDRLDQYFHVSEKKTVFLFALLMINILSAVLIQLIAVLTQHISDFWMLMLGGYLGYFCYFMMLAVYISALKADRSIQLKEMKSIVFKGLIFSFIFYCCAAVLSVSAFGMLINGSSMMISLGIGLLVMLFILFYVPFSLIFLFLSDTSENPFVVMQQSCLMLFRHIRKCLGLVCIFAVLEGIYMGISNLFFQTSLDFNPLVMVTEILTRCDPWTARLSTIHIMQLILTIIYGILFTFVFFYALYALKEIVENQ